MSRWIWALCLGVGIGVGMVVSISLDLPGEAPAAPPRPADPSPSKGEIDAFSRRFVDVVKAVRPSVVQVDVVRRFRQTDPFAGFWGDDPLLERFFGRRRRDVVVEQPSFGSGVIVGERGHILTNHHVVSGADEIKVRLSDGREIWASMVGEDPLTDLAIIQIKEQGLRSAPLGDSSAVEVGEWVLALGSPLGYMNTVTEGIVSALQRHGDYTDYGTYRSFLQTSAPINPGNSGGPLVNLRGEVIGINTAIASYTGQSAGIGFATPANLAKEVMEEILARGGRVERGWLGVQVEPAREGAAVRRVFERSPAARAFQPGDVILELDGERIADPDALIRAIFKAKPGTKVPIRILRDGEEISFSIPVYAHPLTARR